MKNITAGRLGGFTLIELLVVVLIIGILAAVALPQYEKAVQKARVTEAMGILKKIVDNIDMCVLANGGTDNCDEDIVFEGLEQFANNGGLSTKNFDYGTYGFALAMDKQQNYTLALASHTMEEIVGAPEGRWCLPGTEKGLAFCKSLSGKAPTDWEGNALYPF